MGIPAPEHELRLLFLSRPGIHVRYFRALAEILPRSRVEAVRAVRRAEGNEFPADDILERLLRVHVARRFQRAPRVFRYRLLRAIYLAHLRRAARRLYAHWLARLGRERGQWDAVAVWNGLRYPDAVLVAAAREAGLPVVHFELGALPESLSIDLHGVNFDNSVPRTASFYLRHCEQLPPATPLPLRPRRPRRGKRLEVAALPERFLFAPFQVNYDTQIVAHSPWIGSMHHWYEVLAGVQQRLRAEGDPRVIVLREHPSDMTHYPDLHERAQRDGMLLANGNDMRELLDRMDVLLTINSSTGIEALLRGRKVIVCGQAFYDIDGLVLRARDGDSLLAAIREADHWKPDGLLRERFLAWLEHEYYVPRFQPKGLASDDAAERREHQRRLELAIRRIHALLAPPATETRPHFHSRREITAQEQPARW